MKVNHWFAQILYIIIIFITRKKFYKKHLTLCCIGATLYIRNKNRKPNNVPSISFKVPCF